MSMRMVWRSFLVAGAVAAACHGQQYIADFTANTAAAAMNSKGLQFYGVSVNSGYSTAANPVNSANPYAAFALNTQSDWTYGAQWSLGWQHTAESNHFAVRYTGMYSGQERYSNLNAFGHSLVLGYSRTIHTKWSLNISANGDYRTLVEYLFEPNALGNAAQSASSFDNLAATAGIGTYSDPTAAATLNGAPAISTLTAVLMGDRILTYAAQMGATYSPSTRLHFMFSSVTAGGQTTFENQPTFTLPRQISATAGGSFSTSYSLSPRTTIGFNVGETRTFNKYQGSYNTDAVATFGRKMTDRLFFNMHAGGTYIRATKQVYGNVATRNIIGGASLGYKVYDQTLLATYSRSSYDAYGLSGLSTSYAGSWSWRRPGSAWMLRASGGRNEFSNPGFIAFRGWSANAGATRMLSARLASSIEFGYLDSTGSYLGSSFSRTAKSVRMSLAWHPQWILP